MTYPNKVVVAVNFNKDTLETLHTLKKMNNILGEAEIHFVHVFEVMVYSFDLTSRIWPDEGEQAKIKHDVESRLCKLTEEILPKGHNHKIVIECFFDVNPKEKLCDYIKDIHASMAIVATRGKKGIQGFFDSSFAQYLCKFSPASVLVLRPHHK